MLQHLPDVTLEFVLFLVYAFYLVARCVYFCFRREHYTAGYHDGTYSLIDRRVKMRYHADTNTCACVVSDTEFNSDTDAAYKRYCQGA